MGESIKNWAEDDRPREKMLAKGRLALSDAEILAILLRSGSRRYSALQVAQKILKHYENLEGLSKASVQDLTQFQGVGKTKAITIVAALEMGRRRSSFSVNRDKISGSQDVYELIRPYFVDLSQEECHIVLLNQSNKVMGTECISRGGMNAAVVDGKVVFRHALSYKAVSIILVHNHPSGNLQPSQSDIELTERLKKFGNWIDMRLLDHLIITDEYYFSFADEGKI